MTYQHSDLSRPRAPAKARAMAVPARRPLMTTGVAVRFAAILSALLALFLVGQAAARATESLAMGIIAADLVFLIIVACWSAVAVVRRG